MAAHSIDAIVLDCQHAAPLARFWAEALGWSVRPYDDEEIARLAALGHTPETDPSVAVDSPDGSLTLLCIEVPEPKVGKNRMHVDIRVTSAEHMNRLLELGASVLGHQPEWTVMADPEGNEFCIVKPHPSPE
jgi:hypothetical protein